MSFRALMKHIVYQLFSPDTLIRRKYEAFKALLEHDHRSHELVALLEKNYYDERSVDFCAVVKTYRELSHSVSNMIRSLDAMAPRSYGKLFEVFRIIDSAIRDRILRPGNTHSSPPFVLSLQDVPSDGENLAGGKAFNLSRILTEVKLPVPRGFVITSNAFNYFCEANHLGPQIEAALADLDLDSPSSLEATSEQLMSLITNAPLPLELEKAVSEGYARTFRSHTLCAMRSSAVGEDAAFSFAGQYRSVLNVGPRDLSKAYKEVIAGKYSPRAILYRVRNGFLDGETPMAVLVLEMIDAGASGILYSKNPVSSRSDSVTIYSVWGLGELLVKGAVAPDVIEVLREEDRLRILRDNAALKESKLTLSRQGDMETVPLGPEEKERLSLDESDALQLAAWGLRLESWFEGPQDMEWCRSREGNLYVLQSRPLRLETPGEMSCEIDPSRIPNAVLLSGGEKAASGIGAGRVVTVISPSELKDVPENSVLVVHTTSPKWVQVIDRLSAVVTDVGSVAGHFASVAREWGVPALVNMQHATQVLKPGETVTVDADQGKVFAGVVQERIASPCNKKKFSDRTPFMKRLRFLLDSISPLNLVNPEESAFLPENCRTLHDVLRFTHEKAVQEMFSLGGKGRRKLRGAKKLISDIPITLYILDRGGGLHEGAGRYREVRTAEIKNPPLRSLWKGLSHPDIYWSPYLHHFDWQEFDRVSGGIISPDSQLLSSFAVMSADYLNINIRFGYHFVVLDTLCGPGSRENYISLRFKGGGAAFEGRHLRTLFLERVLGEHGFETHMERDMIDVRLVGTPPAESEAKLEMLGFLLGFTRLLDMKLRDRESVEVFVDEFLQKAPPF